MRCTAQLSGGPRGVSTNVAQLIALEETLGLQRAETFKVFARAIDGIKARLDALLGDLRAQGKIIAGYGASATVTTLVYHFGLGPALSFIVDDNLSKQGLFSPGLHIPVLSPQMLYERKPDYVLILAWRFSELIIKRHQAFLQQGGRLIVPLPKPEIL